MSSSCPVASRRRDEPADDVVELDDRVLVGVLRPARCPRTARSGSCRSARRGCCGTGTTARRPSPCARGTRSSSATHFSSSSERTGIVTSSTSSVVAAAHGVHEALVERQVLDPLRARLAVDDLGEEGGVPPLRVHVRDGQEAVEVVEADVLGLGVAVLAHVPLADGLGDVARLVEQLGDRHLAGEPAGLAVHRRALQAVADREPTRHERGARGGARRLRVARGEQEARAPRARRCAAWARRRRRRRRSSRSRPSRRRP